MNILCIQMIQLEDEGSSNMNNGLKLLAKGSHRSIVHYSGCIINGHKFCIQGCDLHKKTQNSGIIVKTEHDCREIIYYSIVNDIIQLSYGLSNNLFYFKCNWWDTVHKSKISINEFRFLSINITKTYDKEKSYVFASQVEKVIYLPNTKLGKNWRVVKRMALHNLYDPQVTKINVDTDEVYQQNKCHDDIIQDVGDELNHCLTRTNMEDILVDVNNKFSEAGPQEAFVEDTNLDNEQLNED